MDRDPFDLVGDVLDGQFRVDSFAGEGDLSVVYKGHHLGVDAPVAIKCLNLPATLDASHARPLVDSFKEASRIHYRLARGNLHIAQSIGSGTTVAPRTGAVVPYLVREWFEGESLAAELARRREQKKTGRAPPEAMALLEAAFEGVSHAHQLGEVHLSLNPSNLFLATRSDGTTLKVLDFGVSSAMNEKAGGGHGGPAGPTSRRALRVLFPAYAAPEQLDTSVGDPGPWTDVYALALITLEVLSDRVVMSEQDTGAIIEHALDERRRPTPQAHGLKLPRNLELVLTRALLRAPDRRPKNAMELWRDIRSAMRPAASRSNVPAVVARAAPGTAAATLSAPAPALSVPPAPALSVPPAPSSAPAVSPAPASAPAMPPAPLSAPAASPAPASAPAIAPALASAPAGAPAPIRAKAATLVGMGIAAPAVVVGAVGSRLKVPSTPSVETRPMSFSPSGREDPFGAEPATIRKTVTLPAPALVQALPPLPAPAPIQPVAAPTPSPPPVAPAFDVTDLPPVAPMIETAAGAVRPFEAPAAFLPVESQAPPAARPGFRLPALTRNAATILAIGTMVVGMTLIGVVVAQRHGGGAGAPATGPATATGPAPATGTATGTATATGPATGTATAAAAATGSATGAATASAPESATGAAPATASPASPEPALPHLTTAAARRALDATSRVVAKCRHGGKSWGTALATVTFANDGTVSRVVLGSPFHGTPSGDCVIEGLSAAHVPPFGGKPRDVVYRFFVAIK